MGNDDLIEFEWGNEDDANKMREIIERNLDDPFEVIEKELGWTEVLSLADTRPRELMEYTELLINLGAKLYDQGCQKLFMINYADGIWIKVGGKSS